MSMPMLFGKGAVAPAVAADLFPPPPAHDLQVVPNPCFSNTFVGSSSEGAGVPSDSEDDKVEEELVESKSDGSLASLDSLEQSLPIKQGLSDCYSGKSRSFGNVADVGTVKEIEKREHPFNKRRRIMIAYKGSKESSRFYALENPNLMPLLALKEDCREEDLEKEEEQHRLHHIKQQFKSF